MQRRRIAIILVLPCGALGFVELAPAPAGELPIHPRVERYEGQLPYHPSPDCVLQDFNLCSGWIWVFGGETQGAQWGHVFEPWDCPGGCAGGGCLRSVQLYARCRTSPARIGGVRVEAVDAMSCPTALLVETGPLDLAHCLWEDRWTTIPLPPAPVSGSPIAVSFLWGPPGEVEFASDNALANLYCFAGLTGFFPGCYSTVPTCGDWIVGPQKSFIFVTDFNGDTELDDLCAIYGTPYSLEFPYTYGYNYMSNNLLLSVELSCDEPSAVTPTSWGRVKALYK